MNPKSPSLCMCRICNILCCVYIVPNVYAVYASRKSCVCYIDTSKTIMATINATGESRRPIIKGEDAADESEPAVDPAASPPDEPTELVAVAAEPVVVAVVRPVPVTEELVPMSVLPFVFVHSPLSPASCEASVSAAGVEPQFSYCCKWISLFSRSKTAVANNQYTEARKDKKTCIRTVSRA